MTEENFLDELALAEGELIDDYVGGRLTDAERAGFERNFLSTEERRRQLRFTQALGRYADAAGDAAEPYASREPSTRPAPTFGEKLRAFWAGLSAATRAGLAFACVAVIAGAVWLALPAAAPSFNPSFPALTLSPAGGTRATGPEAPKVTLSPGGGLNLVLTLPEGSGPANAYRAEVLTSAGRAEAVEVVGSDERTVSVVVPEGRLARGQYAVRLHAVGADKTERQLGSYRFDVE